MSEIQLRRVMVRQIRADGFGGYYSLKRIISWLLAVFAVLAMWCLFQNMGWVA